MIDNTKNSAMELTLKAWPSDEAIEAGQKFLKGKSLTEINFIISEGEKFAVNSQYKQYLFDQKVKNTTEYALALKIEAAASQMEIDLNEILLNQGKPTQLRYKEDLLKRMVFWENMSDLWEKSKMGRYIYEGLDDKWFWEAASDVQWTETIANIARTVQGIEKGTSFMAFKRIFDWMNLWKSLASLDNIGYMNNIIKQINIGNLGKIDAIAWIAEQIPRSTSVQAPVWKDYEKIRIEKTMETSGQIDMWPQKVEVPVQEEENEDDLIRRWYAEAEKAAQEHFEQKMKEEVWKMEADALRKKQKRFQEKEQWPTKKKWFLKKHWPALATGWAIGWAGIWGFLVC